MEDWKKYKKYFEYAIYKGKLDSTILQINEKDFNLVENNSWAFNKITQAANKETAYLYDRDIVGVRNRRLINFVRKLKADTSESKRNADLIHVLQFMRRFYQLDHYPNIAVS